MNLYLPYFWNKKTQIYVAFFVFISSNFGFVTADALIYVNIIDCIHCNKSKVAQNEKQNPIWVFLFQKYGKFWSVSLELFIKHKLWSC